MALSGIQIYQLLPKTNCKDCNFPTCLAFAMKLAAKQVELAACPHVSEESKEKLSEASAPPVRPITLKSNGYELKSGGEVVLYRHEKTFYNRPGLFVRVWDSEPVAEIKAKAAKVNEYKVDYVGIELEMGGIAIQANGGDFEAAIAAVREVSHLPLILIGDVETLRGGLERKSEGETLLLCHATKDNWEAMAALAKEHGAALGIKADTIDEMVMLSEKVKGAGVDDIVLSPTQRGFLGTLQIFQGFADRFV